MELVQNFIYSMCQEKPKNSAGDESVQRLRDAARADLIYDGIFGDGHDHGASVFLCGEEHILGQEVGLDDPHGRVDFGKG